MNFRFFFRGLFGLSVFCSSVESLKTPSNENREAVRRDSDFSTIKFPDSDGISEPISYINSYSVQPAYSDQSPSPFQLSQPSNSFRLPSEPLNFYGLNQKASNSYEPPQEPSSSYGTPQQASNSYGTPQEPSSSYGTPQQASNAYGTPQEPSSSYGTPQQASNSYGTPQEPSSSYGTPPEPSNSYGGQKIQSSLQPQPQAIPSMSYGSPGPEYGAPSNAASSTHSHGAGNSKKFTAKSLIVLTIMSLGVIWMLFRVTYFIFAAPIPGTYRKLMDNGLTSTISKMASQMDLPDVFEKILDMVSAPPEVRQNGYKKLKS